MSLTYEAKRLVLISSVGTIAILLALLLLSGPVMQAESELSAAPSPLPVLLMVPWVCRPQSVEVQARRLSLEEATTSAAVSLAAEETYAIGLLSENARPAPADAWLEQLRPHPKATAIFEAIYYGSDTTTAGRLQALRGLFQTERAKFDFIASRLRNNGLAVTVQRGCIMESVTVKDVVEEIEKR